MVVLTYAPLFWGIRHVPSGLTAVLDLALTPVPVGVRHRPGRGTLERSARGRSALALPDLPCCSARSA